MKFTNGYWLIRPNFQMQYATQAVRVENILRDRIILRHLPRPLPPA